MYSTEGIDAIATITELRSNTSELLEHVRDNDTSVLIQKNNEAYAVLISWETYKMLVQRSNESRKATEAPGKRRARRENEAEGDGNE